jgi:acyl-CoA thioester hydrolase
MEGFRLAVPVRPRFRDTDAMGHVNNAVYLTYFEVARTEYWRALTGSARYEQVPFILAHTTVDFRSPALVSEELTVGIRVSRIGRSSFECAYRVEEAATGRLVCEGRSVQVIYDYARAASHPVPEDLRARLVAFEGDPGLSARA